MQAIPPQQLLSTLNSGDIRSIINNTSPSGTSTSPQTLKAAGFHFKKKKISPKSFILLICVLLATLVGATFFIFNTSRHKEEAEVVSLTRSAPLGINTGAVVATVGVEDIYQLDIEREVSFFPQVDFVEQVPIRTVVLEKIIDDSILLQELATPEQLTPEVFNSIEKDYVKRTSLITELKNQYRQRLAENTQISGTLLTVWYYNTTEPLIGLEEARAVARSKLSALREQVAESSMTVEEAIAKIKSDSELSKLDGNYQGNAFANFAIDTTTSDGPTKFSPAELYDEVLSLQVGEVSSVYEAIIAPEERYFVFAVVSNKPSTPTSESYQDWFTRIKQKYVPK
jgi:hypothetical protein